MTYLDYSGLAPSVAGQDPLGVSPGDTGVPAITPNLPNAMTSLINKYQGDNLPALHRNYDSTDVNSFVQWEYGRAQRGIAPTSPKQTIQLLNAAKTRTASTKPQQRDPLDFLGNVANDVEQLVTNIPRLPVAVAHEIEDLPNFAKRVKEGGGGLAGFLSAPGINLIPGAYTARNIVTGNVGEALSHPVMTALDVLPAAHALGVGEKLASIKLPGDVGTVGDLAHNATAALGRTAVGRLAREAWDPAVRAMSRGEYAEVARLANRSNPALSTLYSDPLSRLAQDTNSFVSGWQRDVPDVARRAQITDALQQNGPAALDHLDLNDAETARVQQYLDLSQRHQAAGLETGNIAQRDVGGTSEVFSLPQARRLDALSAQATRYRTLAGLRSAISGEADFDAGIVPQATSALTDPTLSNTIRRQIATGLVHALDANGFVTGNMYADASKLTVPRVEDFLGRVNSALSTEQVAREDVELPTQAGQSRDRWLSDNRRYTDAAAARRESAVDRLTARVVPARFTPAVEQRVNARVGAAVNAGIAPDNPDLPRLAEAVTNRDYGQLIDRGILDPTLLAQWRSEAAAAWQQMRGEGANPTYVHATDEGRVVGRGPRTITTVAPTPTQYGNRVYDFTPSSSDLGVAVDAQRIELLKQDGAKSFLSYMEDPANGLRGYALRTRAEWEDTLRPAAQRASERNGKSYAANMEALMKRTAVPWDQTRTAFLTGRFGEYKYSSYADRDALLISRPVADSMARMTRTSPLERILSPSTNLFRTAVLPFSVRFMTNVIFGHMLTMAMEDPRALASVPEGFRIARDMQKMNAALAKGEEYTLPERTADVFQSMSPTMRSQLRSLEYSVNPDRAASFMSGRKLGEFWNKARTVGNALNRVADKSYSFTGMFDDMWRSAGYLSEYKRAIASGLTEAESAARGEALVMKFAARWNEMTPLERSVFRPLVPFYSYLSHIIRYAYRYPMDHPFRVAIGSSLIRNEVHDFGTGLPQSMMAMFGLGNTDASGNQTFIDVHGMNPFRSLGDSLSIAGFLAETNPIFRTVLQAAGYDSLAKGPNIYPEVQYNPQTGRMEAVQPNTPGMLSQIATTFIPQTQLIGAVLGTNADFNNLVRTNPDAASRLLLSQAGLPLLWRNVNVPQASFAAELARATDQKTVLSQAMKSGDYSRALRYPGLVPVIQQLQSLQRAGKLAPFNAATSPKTNIAQQELASEGV